MSIRALRQDRRGSAAVGPVFVIISIIILAGIFAALVTTHSVRERSSSSQQMTNTHRSAVAAIGAELNTRTPEQITASVAASGYTPASWIPATGESMRLTGFVLPAPERAEVTFTFSAGTNLPPRTTTIEYQLTPVLRQNGEWVRATSGTTPERSIWLPARTIPGAP